MPTRGFRMSLADALTAVDRTEERVNRTMFVRGALDLEFYAPKGCDRQSPHPRDEVYVVVRGNGTFSMDGRTEPFQTGDVLFVPAGAEHRFESFSGDFGAWVMFYGPDGGERVAPSVDLSRGPGREA